MKNLRKDVGVSFDEALKRVMASVIELGSERVDIEGALNRVLAEAVISDVEMPPFNKSAMDGFACHRADLSKELVVIETIPAGYMPKKQIKSGQCAKIMTGAVVPKGADCVIMVEYTEHVFDNRIRFTGRDTYDNICFKSEDVKKGDVVLQAGQIIKAQDIAVLTSLGCIKPLVSLRPKVGIIATGDELVEPGQKPKPFQIRNSNSFQLAAQVENAGATATNYGIAADTEKDIYAMLKKAKSDNDVVILSGGVSAGDYDLVREILKKSDFDLLFEKISVKPGRPAVFGIYKNTKSDVERVRLSTKYAFGLPGNPVSTFIVFELLVKPFLYRMAGHNFKPAISYNQLEKTVTRKKTERDSWLPVVFTKNGKAAVIEYHGSAHINALSKADGLICIPTSIAEIKEGTTVAVRQI